MFTLALRRVPLGVSPVPLPVPILRRAVPLILNKRPLHTSPYLLKPKTKKNDKNAKKSKPQEESEDGVQIDFKDITSKFEDIISKFTSKANEIKLGKTSPKIFDHLNVDIHGTPSPFTSLASTTVKGRNLVITVFDNSYNSNIINAILDSDLNLNPVQDPNTPSQLKVPLPPITDEIKTQQVKLLKHEFERFKSSNKSLNSIRQDTKKKYEKLLKNEEDRRQFKQFETLHKEYLNKLTSVLKASEQQLLK